MCVAVVAFSLAILLLCFITFIAFYCSVAFCQLLIKFMMMMMMTALCAFAVLVSCALSYFNPIE